MPTWMPSSSWVVQSYALDVLREVLGVFAEAGILAVPVKGVLTGRLLYKDPTERPLTDIDLRIAMDDFARAKAAGIRAGWDLLEEHVAYQSMVFACRDFHVDIETHLVAPGFSSLTISEMLTRATEQFEPLGFRHLQLDIHDHALLLCSNVFKDKLSGAAAYALSDVDRIVLNPSFRANKLIRLAEAANNLTMLWLVADWFATERNSEAWRDIRDGFTPRRGLYRTLFGRLARMQKPAPQESREASSFAHRFGGLALRMMCRSAPDRFGARIHSLTVMARHAIETKRQLL